ncbi:magnesium-translocating P-type ATPase [Labilithrix luteola]|uniref:magnesium-translocating P-type ATPase n=1 Tax=Labilithrix luteola TaxID=1391654 RepID=UPI0011BA8774|nr:magnesium-translocating P-type ATPase [Labilithrix luteola]
MLRAVASLSLDLKVGRVESGLTTEEALRRLARDGLNEPLPRHRPRFRMLVRRFANPLVGILVIASIASMFVGDPTDAAVILAIVTVSAVLDGVQTRRAHRAADALRESISTTATVLRDGAFVEIPRAQVVEGDVVRLSAGDLVPADVELTSSKDLHAMESALTGESLPSEKDAHGDGDAVRAWLGSSIVSGTGTGRVFATGPRTRFGGIAASLHKPPPPTEFERGLASFGAFILKTVLFLVLFVFVVTAWGKRDPLQALLFSVALAVGLTPEFLPVITTITLTRSAVRMAHQRCIVKSLAAIQDLGSVDVLCSDKTGTLTTGEMSLEAHVDPTGKTQERPLLLACVNSFFESGVENPVDAAVLRHGRLDPLDRAVLQHEHPDIHGFEKIDEMPFDFERRRVSVVVKRERAEGEEYILVTKGAPEQVLASCTEYELDGVRCVLDTEAVAQARRTLDALGAKGYRTLAVAWRPLPRRVSYGLDDERNLVLSGFIAFFDPPRADARETVETLVRRGVRTKILTGDAKAVAQHVAERVGLSSERILVGDEIDKMTDPALAHHVEQVDVFARLSPAQKTRILAALRSRGHVTGFLGDGINDAPSLHAADVGIAVAGAVDVAKEAAQVILLEPGLGVLLEGIVEGRKAFGNVLKYLLMGTSSNFGNMFSMAGAAVALPFLPMLPTQILLNNFLYDLAQVTIPTDNVDDVLVRSPRRWDIGLVRRFMAVLGPISSLYDFLTFAVLLHVLHASERAFHTGWFVESLATQTLVIFVIRTVGSPWTVAPSRPLVFSALVVVAIGMLLPYAPPLARMLGFEPLPIGYFGFLVVATGTYLYVVDRVKRRLLRHTFSS